MANTTDSSVTFRVTDIKRIKTPYDGTDPKTAEDYVTTARTYLAAVHLKNVPAELANWRKVNVRDPLMTSGVAKGIVTSLHDNPEAFFFKNRGLTIIADNIMLHQGAEPTVELFFGDPQLSGLLDGGHTYTAIRNYISELDEEELDNLEGHVKVEIIVGLKAQDDIVSVVEARNTATQVKEESLQELASHFEMIKAILRDKPYFDQIAFKEVELSDDGNRKNIDIKEILSYLICFDAERFPMDSKEQPTIAYSSKGAIVKYFKDDGNRQRLTKYISLLPDILELRDRIYAELPSAYNADGGRAFGKLTGVTRTAKDSQLKLPFSSLTTPKQIPSPFIYPILAAFRSLVRIDGDKVEWMSDPFVAWDTQKTKLAASVGDDARKLQNPNKMGKQKSLWETCYRDLLVARLTSQI